MALYSVHCSVCKTDYSSKSEWNDHLTQDKHQNSAKQKCWSESDKDSCLVVYSSFQLTVTSGIQYFSANWRNWVTDFVNWEERPFLAIVQFESREKATQIVSEITKPDLRIDGLPVEIKLASQLLDLEWDSYLPSHHSSEEPEYLAPAKRKLSPTVEHLRKPLTKKPKKDNIIHVPLIRKGRKKAADNLKQYAKQCGWKPPKYQLTEHPSSRKWRSSWSCSVILNDVKYSPPEMMPSTNRAQHNAAYYCQEMLLKTQAESQSNNDKPTDKTNRTADALQNEFWKLCETVTLPETKYDMFMELGRFLETLFCELDPQIRVVLFRNFHLKLATGKELLFYVYSTGSSSYVSDTTVEEVFSSPTATRIFNATEHVDALGPKFQYKDNGTYFTIVTKPHLLVEVQLCRLLEYLCTFDNRCLSLITLCWFWWERNGVDVCEDLMALRNRVEITSDPLTLEWMVIHYLCHEGILPTVREIQQRRHTEENYGGVDVGFCADPEFVREWKSRRNEACQSSHEYALSVLELFQGFLKFYGETLATGKWILNTRDGEVFKMGEILSGEVFRTKMTKEDLSALRKIQAVGEDNTQQFRNDVENGIPEVYQRKKIHKIDLSKYKLYIVHPFIYTWRFGLNKKIYGVLYKMARTLERLDLVLKMRKWGEESSDNLEHVLTFGHKWS